MRIGVNRPITRKKKKNRRSVVDLTQRRKCLFLRWISEVVAAARLARRKGAAAGDNASSIAIVAGHGTSAVTAVQTTIHGRARNRAGVTPVCARNTRQR
jgi:hypothetical protein